jgi:hypothetical protein
VFLVVVDIAKGNEIFRCVFALVLVVLDMVQLKHFSGVVR